MSIRLNEIAIRQLLEFENGPVGRDLARRAENITEQARENAANIVKTLDMTQVIDYRISTDDQGLFAAIGVFGLGSISRYLAAKAAREAGGGWLIPALAAGRD